MIIYEAFWSPTLGFNFESKWEMNLLRNKFFIEIKSHNNYINTNYKSQQLKEKKSDVFRDRR